MDDIDLAIKEYREEKQRKYDEFMDACRRKFDDGELIYRAMALFIAKMFKVEISSYGDISGAVYLILNHYIEEVEDEDFESWIGRNDGPFIRPMRDLRKIFPEFMFIKDNDELLETVNTVYGLSLESDFEEEYIYSLSMDFESFTPIDVGKIHEIKEEIRILKKYGYDVSDLEKELEEFNLKPEILEVI